VDHVVTSVQAIASRWPLGTLKVELKATKERKTKSKALAGDIARCEAVLYKNDHRVTHLSSGEQRRVQIALFEALRSVLGGLAGVSCNIAIFDETLDTNVDDSGAEELMNGLKVRMGVDLVYLLKDRVWN
jgi:energy-coupling factor transporter ATP-binding protein EcfA2